MDAVRFLFKKLNRKKLISVLSGIAVAVVAVTCLITVFIKTSAANDAILYALVVNTGDSNGDDVDYFVVEYKGTDNRIRRTYIEPHNGDFAKSYELVSSFGLDERGAKRKSIVQQLGYTCKSWDDQKGTGTGPLQSNTQDIYFFNVVAKVDSIVSVSVISNGNSQNQRAHWTCYGLSIYKVNGFSKKTMVGFVSDQLELNFKGDLVAKLSYSNSQSNKSLSLDFEFGKAGMKRITTQPTNFGNGSSVYLQTQGFESSNYVDGIDDYMIKIDFADIYKGGLEEYSNGYAKKPLKDLKPAEFMVMQLKYEDVNNVVHSVKIPVLTSALGYAMDKGIISMDTVLADIAFQSGSLAFSANLPGFSSLLDCKIIYVTSENTLKTDSGFYSVKGTEPVHNSHYSGLKSDTVYIDGIQLFKGDGSVSVSLENGAFLYANANGNSPIYYFMSGDTSTKLAPGSSTNLNLFSFKPGSIYTAYDERIYQNHLYLVELKTGDGLPATKTGELKIKLKYATATGSDGVKTINVKSDCKEYYGYWPDGSGEDSAYKNGTKAKGVIYYLIDIKDNVDYFNSIEFNNSTESEWVTSCFAIYRVREKSGIFYEWYETFADGNVCNHYRTINGEQLSIDQELEDEKDCLIKIGDDTSVSDNDISVSGNIGDEETTETGNIYVGPGKTKIIDYNSKKISEVNVHDPDFFKHLYNMDYNYACSNHGFAVPETEYTVSVNVASEAYSSSGDDDSGSANFFYFQLIFESGKSGYVQANQQLESDGFRSGVTEKFTIKVNRDYGKLVAVKIIPETDVNVGKPYDKLQISSIDIARSMGNGFGENYRISDIGWIGIDYYENTANQPANTELELAKTFPVSGINVCVDILFTINTASYPPLDNSGTYNQFQGKLFADINYVDDKGEMRTDPGIDVVEMMYKFDGKAPDRGNDLSKSSGCLSNTNLMFRQSSADRFIWHAIGVDYIDSITFYAENASGQPVVWVVDSVSIALIKSGDIEKDRGMNSAHEYVIEGGTTIKIATSDNEMPYYVDMQSNNKGLPLCVEFSRPEGGGLASQMKSGAIPYVISKVPASQNDMVNVYAYLNPNANPAAESFNTICKVVYNDNYGVSRESTAVIRGASVVENSDSKQKAFIVKGLGTQEFSTMGFVQLSASGAASVDVPIDYVVVQRIRNNVVIETYKLRLGAGGTVNIAQSHNPQRTEQPAKPMQTKDEYQEITIQLGEQTDTETILEDRVYDIAIALKYRPEIGGPGDEYQTEFKFVAEDGGGIKQLKKNRTITIRMNMSGIKEITGLVIGTSSFLNVQVDRATVGLYKASGTIKYDGSGELETNYVCTSWYSFGDTIHVCNETRTLYPTCVEKSTSGTISPVTFTFKTAKSVEGYGDAVGIPSDSHIKMQINYINNGSETSKIIDDIALYREDWCVFSAGNTAIATLLLEGINANNVQSIVLTPSDDDPARVLYWGLESININFGDGQGTGDELNAVIDDRRVFLEDGTESDNLISFTSVRLVAHAYEAIDKDRINTDKYLTVGNQSKEGKVAFNYDENGSLFGMIVQMYNSNKDFEVTFDEFGKGEIELLSKNGNILMFKVTGLKYQDIERTITITSIENPKCYVVYKVHVYKDDTAESVSVNIINTVSDNSVSGNSAGSASDNSASGNSASDNSAG